MSFESLSGISRRTLRNQLLLRPNAQIGGMLHLRFRGRVLLLARLLWLMVLVFSLWTFVATISSRQQQMLDVFAANRDALQQLGLGRDFLPQYIVVLDAMTLGVYALVAVLIFWRKSTEWVALFASLALSTAGITSVRPSDSLVFVDPALRVPLLVLFALGTDAIIIFLYIFPDGHFTPRWTVWIALLSVLYTTAFYLLPVMSQPILPWPPPPVSPIVLLGIAAGGLAQIYRYRRVSNRGQQQQTKWVVYGLTIGIVGLLVFLLVVPSLYPQVVQPGLARVFYILVGLPLFDLSLMFFPLSIGISILRFRLWDIDLLINRTLVYLPLSGILAGLFAALITLSQKVFTGLTGQESDLVAVLTTLIVVAAFTPIKERLQVLVDKRFKEPSDAAKELQAFGEQVKARVSQVHAQQITARLLDEAVTAFGAKGGVAFLEGEGPLSIVFASGEWNGEAALTVPFASAPHVKRLGTISLAARSSGADYTPRDRDTLEDITQVIAQAIEEDRHLETLAAP